MVQKPSITVAEEPHFSEEQTQDSEQQSQGIRGTSDSTKSLVAAAMLALPAVSMSAENGDTSMVVPVNISLPSQEEDGIQRLNFAKAFEGMRVGTYSVSIPGIVPGEGEEGTAYVEAAIADEVTGIGLGARVEGIPRKENGNLVVDVVLEVNDVDAYQSFLDREGFIKGPLMKVYGGSSLETLRDLSITFDEKGLPVDPIEGGTDKEKENWLEGVITKIKVDGLIGEPPEVILGERIEIDVDTNHRENQIDGQRTHVDLTNLDLQGEPMAVRYGGGIIDHNTGNEFVVKVRAYRERDENGKRLFLEGVETNMTEEEQAKLMFDIIARMRDPLINFFTNEERIGPRDGAFFQELADRVEEHRKNGKVFGVADTISETLTAWDKAHLIQVMTLEEFMEIVATKMMGAGWATGIDIWWGDILTEIGGGTGKEGIEFSEQLNRMGLNFVFDLEAGRNEAELEEGTNTVQVRTHYRNSQNPTQ